MIATHQMGGTRPSVARPRRPITTQVSGSATVRDLLEEIASQNREFKEALFNPETGDVAVHISLILNGSFLELSGRPFLAKPFTPDELKAIVRKTLRQIEK